MKISQEAEQCLTALCENGRLTLTQVVDEARRPESPLHPYFEWDDERARLAMARRLLLRALPVRMTTGFVVRKVGG